MVLLTFFWAGDIFYLCYYNFMCLCIYIYIRIYAISYTLIVVNISIFHRLMSFEGQSCVNLNGGNRKEGQIQQEKKSFIDRKSFEAIICK